MLFCIGKFISVFGTATYTFATGIYILKLTGSALGFATNLILSTIPMLIISPFAGVMADRLNKKKLVVSADLLNGLFILLIYFLSLYRGLSVSLIYFSTIIITTLTTLFDFSMESAKPDLVADNQLIKINTVGKIIDSLSSILAPVIGGIIFSFFNIQTFILMNGLSFILSSLIEVLMNFDFNRKASKKVHQNKLYIEEIKDGLRYLIHQKNIVQLLFIFILYNLTISFSLTVPLPYLLNNVLNLSLSSYGIIQGCLPIGIILGSLLVPKIMENYKENEIFFKAGTVLSILMLLISTPGLLLKLNVNELTYISLFIMIVFLLGICYSILDIPFICIMQTHIDEDYRARSLSIVMCIIKIVVPISYALSGTLLEIINPYIITLTGALVTFMGCQIFKRYITR